MSESRTFRPSEEPAPERAYDARTVLVVTIQRGDGELVGNAHLADVHAAIRLRAILMAMAELGDLAEQAEQAIEGAMRRGGRDVR